MTYISVSFLIDIFMCINTCPTISANDRERISNFVLSILNESKSKNISN